MAPPEANGDASPPPRLFGGAALLASLAVGDQVMALTRPRARQNGAITDRSNGCETHRPGDLGCVSGVAPRVCYVTWERTGRTTKHEAAKCEREFSRVLEIEDRVRALPRESYIVNGTENFTDGDLGSVVRKDKEKYYVLWARTLKTTGIPRDQWPEFCERIKRLQVGDRVRSLPGRSLCIDGVELYKEGDIGVVERADEQTCSIVWERTGRKTSIQQARWVKVCRIFGQAKARLKVFNLLDVDQSGEISVAEWRSAFSKMDANSDGLVTRKEWQVLDEDTVLFDAIPRRYLAQISTQEWEEAFRRLDADGDGFITVDEWFPQRLRATAEAASLRFEAGDAEGSLACPAGVGVAGGGAGAGGGGDTRGSSGGGRQSDDGGEGGGGGGGVGGLRPGGGRHLEVPGPRSDPGGGGGEGAGRGGSSMRPRLRSSSTHLALQDPAAPRPRWLPTEGPSNDEVPPEEWGLTLGQWAALVVACLLGRGDAKQAEFLDWHRLAGASVVPWTEVRPTEGGAGGGGGSSLALLLNGKRPLKAELFVVHTWDESVLEAMAAVMGKALAMGLDLDVPIWFDVFSRLQPFAEDAADAARASASAAASASWVSRALLAKPAHGVIVAHTAGADIYGRLWCLFELHEASKAGVPARAAASLEYLSEEQGGELAPAGAAAPTCGAARPSLEQADAACATCSSSADERSLRSAIEGGEGGGYRALESAVGEFRLAELGGLRGTAGALEAWARELSEVGGPRHPLGRLADAARGAAVLLAAHCLLWRSCGPGARTERAYEAEVLEFARASAEEVLEAEALAFGGEGEVGDGGAAPPRPPFLDPDEGRAPAPREGPPAAPRAAAGTAGLGAALEALLELDATEEEDGEDRDRADDDEEAPLSACLRQLDDLRPLFVLLRLAAGGGGGGGRNDSR